MNTARILWSVLNPYPLGDTSGEIVAAFTTVILALTLVVFLHELALAWRALRIRWVVSREFADKTSLASEEEVQSIVNALVAVSPELAPAAKKLGESCYRRNGGVYSAVPASELFFPGVIRSPGRGVFLPHQVLISVPGLLTALGILGTFVGLVKGLGDYEAQLNAADFEMGIKVLIAGLSISFRTSVWGLLCSIFITFMGRYSAGQAELAVDRLVGSLDRTLAKGTDQDALERIALHTFTFVENQEQTAQVLEQTKTAMNELLGQHESVLAGQRQLLEALQTNEKGFDRLGESLSAAFDETIMHHLAPTLAEIHKGAAETHQNTRAFLNTSTSEQVKGIQQIINMVVQGIDNAVGAHLLEAGKVIEASSVEQAASARTWGRSVERLAEVLDQMHGVATKLERGAERVAQATGPQVDAAAALHGLAGSLGAFVPELAGASEKLVQAQLGLGEVSGSLSGATADYALAAEAVRYTLSELDIAQQRALAMLIEGIDATLRSSLSDTAADLRSVQAVQAEQLDAWAKAMDTLGPRIDRAAESLTQGHEAARDRMVTGIDEMLRASLTGLSEEFRSLQTVQVDQLRSWEKAMDKLTPSVDGLLEKLNGIHAEATKTLVAGVDDAVQQALSASLENLSGLQQVQAQQLDDWQQTLSTLHPAVTQLEQTSRSVEQAVAGLTQSVGRATSSLEAGVQQASDSLSESVTQTALALTTSYAPAADTAKSFEAAASKLTVLLPDLDQARKHYEMLQNDMQQAMGTLRNTSTTYAQAGERLEQLISGLTDAAEEQRQGSRQLTDTLKGLTQMSEALEPASVGLQGAARSLQEASGETGDMVKNLNAALDGQRETVETLQKGTEKLLEAMGGQAVRWQAVLGELTTVHTALHSGVNALKKELPEAIDHTLVHFDAALGEGVERLGSAVERLREAMDDLQERLEMIMRERK